MPKVQTSSESPLRVAFLPHRLTGLLGNIGLTIAPGKVDSKWRRSLEEDLTRLRSAYETDTLVSLLEPTEAGELGIGDEQQRVEARGTEFLALPIPDVGVPASEAALATLVTAILERAGAGKNVVIHCRGGLGRTGLVAACCLVALGQAPDAAIAAVRRVRDPAAVETSAQERYIEHFADVWRVHGRAELPETGAEPIAPSVAFSRVRGCLLGGALGDALGYPVEFEKSSSEIIRRYGRQAPADLAYKGRALISDDTQMTLFVAEGLIRAFQRQVDRGLCSVESVVRMALLRWHAAQSSSEPTMANYLGWLYQVPALHERRAPGNTCLSALAQVSRMKELPTVDKPINDSKGCGAIMRSAPFGLACGTVEEAFQYARDTGVITHGHPSGYLSAAYFAALIHLVARGSPLPEALDQADRLLAAERGHEETRRAVDAARSLARRGRVEPSDLECLGGGWTGESALAIALAVVLTSDAASPEGFASALWRSVTHGGDSDSTGAVTGNLLGALRGDEVLPPRWVEQVELASVLERIASDLYDTTVLEHALDYDSYPPC